MKSAIFLFGILLFVSAASAAQSIPATAPPKPWLSDWPAFLNTHPQQHWIMGQSLQPALSAEEAETMARADAAKQISGILVGPFTSEEILSEIEASLQRDNWISDQQIDAKERSYGTIWRAAVLVDATSEKLNALSARVESIISHRHRINAIVAGISIIWFVGIAFFFLVLNWITRGYFRARLALVSGLLIVAGIVGVVHLI